MPNFVIQAYPDRLLTLRQYGTDFWTDDFRYSPNQTPEGHAAANAWNMQFVFGHTGEGTIAAVKSALEAFARSNPDIYADVWCKNSPAYAVPSPYAGRYYPATSRNGRIIEQTLYDCPHCAMVSAKRILEARSQLSRGPSVMLGREGGAIPRSYLPAVGEIEVTGESAPDGTATIKDYTGAPGFACGNCGRLAHTSRTCTNPPKCFDRIGVEIEGRFENLTAVQNRCDDAGLTYSGDGSIHESPDSDAAAYELKTKPGSLRETIEQVRDFYPDETDGSCGMHVHMSFLSQDSLTLLHTKAFFAYFKQRWTKWGQDMNLTPSGQFFSRLNGSNDYCNPNTETPRDMTSCDRYMQLNFSAWRGHKTLECRLLPMFRRSSLAVAAITELVSIYEDFLADPEAHGHSWAEFTEAGVPESALSAATFQELPSIELDVLDCRRYEQTHELELTELLPPADNMVRIALPVNQPITVEALAMRLSALRAA